MPYTGPETRSQQNHGPERIEHENEDGGIHDSPRRATAYALRSAPRRQPDDAADERDGEPKARALEQSKPDVLEDIEQLEALDKVLRGQVEQDEAGQPARDDP